jgi:signal transduction histidine kinase
MKSPLHILHLEDDQNDAELIQDALEKDGIISTITRVQTRDNFVSALDGGRIDLIFSDFALPAFDGVSATEIVRTRWPSIPLILVSGSLDENLAITSFKSGATDCVPKNDLSRLAPAVRRAMREVEEGAERQRLQLQVIEAQKMEVISQLSSGVAHDFNNILAIIVGYSDLISLNLSAESSLQKYVEEIRHASNRAAGLTRQLLVFSRKELVRPIVIDLNEAVRDLEIMLRRLINAKIRVTFISGEQIGHVKADTGHIGQLLLNLILNARDAMPQGGEVTVETSDVTFDKNYANAQKEIVSGNYVMLSVRDTGTGMTEEVKNRLFQPFFTTKPYGTGLGLATCRTIVDQSHGHIDVCSEIGKGTTFKIYFPRVEQPLDVTVEPIQSVPSLQRATPLRIREDVPLIPGEATLRVLVVDDESSIRQLNTEMLTRSGYEVDSAVDGEAGWEALQAQSYDLVITDNFMPKITGIEMIKKLHAANMKLPVIMATAIFPQEEFLLNPWLQAVPTLLKPYKTAELLSAVRKVLYASDSGRKLTAPRNQQRPV